MYESSLSRNEWCATVVKLSVDFVVVNIVVQQLMPLLDKLWIYYNPVLDVVGDIVACPSLMSPTLP